MKKDVIYVDIEDDITSIIEKVKQADAKIVALVPPKRIGVLQSVVNLKLLQRAAGAADKRVVMITNNQSLTSLAAGVAMPVAKNLQSKPEIATVSALEVDDEDVINGDELPVGELAATAPAAKTPDSNSVASPIVPSAAAAAARAPKKSSVKIPNFDTFRKKLFIFGGAGLALLLFLVWAIFFAPHATVSITARTTPYGVNKALSMNATAKLDPDQGTIPIVSKELQKTTSVEFPATGKKEVGAKATGSVKFSNTSLSSTSVAAGTQLTSSDGHVFVTDTTVSVPAASFPCGNISCATTGTANGSVTAAGPGAAYNAQSGALSGGPSGVSASFTSASAGGTDKTATVVSQSDIDKAKTQLASQDSNTVKADLKKQFETSVIVIDESFTVTAGDPTSNPALDQEATTAKLTAETKYSIIGVQRTDLDAIVKADITKQIAGLPNQKIYDSGINSVRFTSFSAGQDGAYTAAVVATGYVGPNIDSANLAKQLTGKREGEIQAQVQSIDGVESVETHFSPFWVTRAPSANKIEIKFLVQNAAN